MKRVSQDRGAGAVEYVGVIFLVVALLASVIIAFNTNGRHVGELLLCKLLNAVEIVTGQPVTDCGGTGDPGDDSRVPTDPCVVSSQGGGTTVNVTISFVTTDGGEQWLVEQLGDGRYRLTRIDGGGLGVAAGAGGRLTVTVDGNTYGAGAWADAAAALRLAGGETFTVDSPEAAKALLTQQRQNDVKTVLLGETGTPIRDAWDWIETHLGGTTEGENAVPDEVFVEAGLTGDAEAQVTVVDANAQGNASVKAMLGTTLRKDGTSTAYYSADVGAAGTAGFADLPGVPADMTATAAGNAGYVLEVDYDAKGTPTAMRLVSITGTEAHAGSDDGQQVSKSSMEVPLQTQSDRDLAVRMAASAGIPWVPGLSTGPTIVSPLDISQNVIDFVGAALDHGKYWTEQSTTHAKTNFGIQGDVGIPGLSGGGGLAVTSSQSVTTSYKYWDGTQMVDREGC